MTQDLGNQARSPISADFSRYQYEAASLNLLASLFGSIHGAVIRSGTRVLETGVPSPVTRS
jgi:hypothetical protein